MVSDGWESHGPSDDGWEAHIPFTEDGEAQKPRGDDQEAQGSGDLWMMSMRLKNQLVTITRLR